MMSFKLKVHHFYAYNNKCSVTVELLKCIWDRDRTSVVLSMDVEQKLYASKHQNTYIMMSASKWLSLSEVNMYSSQCQYKYIAWPSSVLWNGHCARPSSAKVSDPPSNSKVIKYCKPELDYVSLSFRPWPLPTAVRLWRLWLYRNVKKRPCQFLADIYSCKVLLWWLAQL